MLGMLKDISRTKRKPNKPLLLFYILTRVRRSIFRLWEVDAEGAAEGGAATMEDEKDPPLLLQVGTPAGSVVRWDIRPATVKTNARAPVGQLIPPPMDGCHD